MTVSRLTIDLAAWAELAKARAKGGAGPGQMSLFGGGAPGQGPKPTEAATHVEIRPVAAHLRQTEHGPVQVAAHTAHRQIAAPEKPRSKTSLARQRMIVPPPNLEPVDDSVVPGHQGEEIPPLPGADPKGTTYLVGVEGEVWTAGPHGSVWGHVIDPHGKVWEARATIDEFKKRGARILRLESTNPKSVRERAHPNAPLLFVTPTPPHVYREDQLANSATQEDMDRIVAANAARREAEHAASVAWHVARSAPPPPATEDPVSVAPAVTGSPTFAIPPPPTATPTSSPGQDVQHAKKVAPSDPSAAADDDPFAAIFAAPPEAPEPEAPAPESLSATGPRAELESKIADLVRGGNTHQTEAARSALEWWLNGSAIGATNRWRVHLDRDARGRKVIQITVAEPHGRARSGSKLDRSWSAVKNDAVASRLALEKLLAPGSQIAGHFVGNMLDPQNKAKRYWHTYENHGGSTDHPSGVETGLYLRPGLGDLAKGASMPGPKMTMRAGPAKPSAPAAPAPPPDPAMNPGPHGAIPPTPGQRVKFNHPATGEETEGHIHAQGGQGATVVDGQGATHRVPHGSYMHVHDATPPGGGEVKPQAELVKQAARKHLELGPSAPLAIYATAALLSIGGVKTVHELNASDVRIKGGCLYVDQDEKKTDDPAVVQMVQLLQHNSPKGPLFQVNGQPMTEQALTQYVQRFGTPQGAGPNPTPPAPMAKAQDPRVSRAIAKFVAEGIPQEQAVAKALAMSRAGRLTDEGEYIHADLHKASAAALILPVTPDAAPSASWQLGDYLVEFRKGSHGVGLVTVDGPGMPIPLHEIVSDPASARQFGADAVAALRKGQAPSRGMFQATR